MNQVSSDNNLGLKYLESQTLQVIIQEAFRLQGRPEKNLTQYPKTS